MGGRWTTNSWWGGLILRGGMPIRIPQAGEAQLMGHGWSPTTWGGLQVVLLSLPELVASPILVALLLQCPFPAESFISCWDGPAAPSTGPPNPVGAWGIGTAAGTPLPAALPSPGLLQLQQAVPGGAGIFGGWSFPSHGNQVFPR